MHWKIHDATAAIYCAMLSFWLLHIDDSRKRLRLFNTRRCATVIITQSTRATRVI